MDTIRIITTNKNIYRKFNKFNFFNEIKFNKKEYKYIDKILKNINFKQKNVIKQNSDNNIVLKKINRVKFNVFYKDK